MLHNEKPNWHTNKQTHKLTHSDVALKPVCRKEVPFCNHTYTQTGMVFRLQPIEETCYKTLSYDSYLEFFNELIFKFCSFITFQLIVLCVKLLLPYFRNLQKRVQMEFVYRSLNRITFGQAWSFCFVNSLSTFFKMILSWWSK